MHNDALSCCLLHKPLPVFQQHCLRQSINFLVREILFACEIEAVSFNIFSPLFFSYNFRISFSSEIISRPAISQTTCPQLLCSPQEGIICGRAAPNQGRSSPQAFSGTGLRTAILGFCFPFKFLPHPSVGTWGHSALVLPLCHLSSKKRSLGYKVPHALNLAPLHSANSFPAFHLTKLLPPTQKVRDNFF